MVCEHMCMSPCSTSPMQVGGGVGGGVGWRCTRSEVHVCSATCTRRSLSDQCVCAMAETVCRCAT